MIIFAVYRSFSAKSEYMSEDKELSSRYQLIVEEWNKAEAAIKIAEQVNREIVIPSINELRYGGRRIIESLACDDLSKKISLLDDAHFDCCRARHDAIDAATSKIAADLDIAVKQLGPDIVLRYFPRVTELNKYLQSIRKKVTESRKDRHNRDNIYAVLQENNLENIADIFEEFKSNEDLMIQAAMQIEAERETMEAKLNAALVDQKDARRKADRNFWIGTAIGTLGVLVAIATLFVSVFS